MSKTTVLVEAVPIVISLIALGHSILKARHMDKNLKGVRDQLAKSGDSLSQSSMTATAALEASLRSAIALARRHMDKLSASMPSELADDDKEKWERLIRSAMEDILNAYEEACAQYRDGRVEKARFKKNFYYEIRQLVEDKNYKAFFDPVSSRYKAILAVYQEWFDLENK